MEIKRRLALLHIETGLYLSWSSDNFPHTSKVSQARRFSKIDEVSVFLSNSLYRPDNPEEYEIVTLKITYEREESEDERTA